MSLHLVPQFSLALLALSFSSGYLDQYLESDFQTRHSTAMANLTQNDTNGFPSGSTESHSTCPDRFHNGIDNGELTALTEVSYVFVIIINSMACLCTSTLNVLVIVAVKRRPRLQNNTNILLACLAGTDLLCGVAVQPSLVVWKAFQFSGTPNNCLLRGINNDLLGYQSLVSVLHLSLVTGERLLAIKYTMHYLRVVTVRNIQLAVITTWVLSTLIEILGEVVTGLLEYLIAFILISCILFIVFSYAILFAEIRRHQKVIKTQQLPQGKVDRHVRDYKAFKTTVYIVSAVLFSFLPMAMALLFRPKKGYGGLYDVFLPWFRTFAMLNSLLNPLVYCWRQKEMRDYIIAMFSPAANSQNVIC